MAMLVERRVLLFPQIAIAIGVLTSNLRTSAVDVVGCHCSVLWLGGG